MKQRFILSILMVGLLAIGSLAQDLELKIEVSLKTSRIVTTYKSVPVKIKITNTSEGPLNTEEIGKLHLYFSKCEKGKICVAGGETLYATIKVENKILKKNESIELKRNLSDFIWKDDLSSYRSAEPNLSNILPENIYFYAAIPHSKYGGGGLVLPEDHLSNQLIVSLNKR